MDLHSGSRVDFVADAVRNRRAGALVDAYFGRDRGNPPQHSRATMVRRANLRLLPQPDGHRSPDVGGGRNATPLQPLTQGGRT